MALDKNTKESSIGDSNLSSSVLTCLFSSYALCMVVVLLFGHTVRKLEKSSIRITQTHNQLGRFVAEKCKMRPFYFLHRKTATDRKVNCTSSSGTDGSYCPEKETTFTHS